eukprot:TRINITY_DN4684_c0_g1_i1.p1 TRINITY_DN4684_c0_g1~~TRINITY_DN4684_c0_g1_i1.p1  ORF type:complete len:328 (+),score=65.56 TRINITY_DN4684_c0_g1_i1:67-1050(+)
MTAAVVMVSAAQDGDGAKSYGPSCSKLAKSGSSRSSPYEAPPAIPATVTQSAYDLYNIPAEARNLRLFFVQNCSPKASAAFAEAQAVFRELFPTNIVSDSAQADVAISLGGDGFLLETCRRYPHLPVYGLNCGSVGFLVNEHRERPRLQRLLREVENANKVEVPFLQVKVDGGEPYYALNEVVISRSTMQAANLSVRVNGNEVVPFLAGDGILVSTPVGSTAYNLSAGGSVLPLNAQMLSLTPICPFRPRRLPPALLDIQDVVVIKNLGPLEKRPVHISFDNIQHSGDAIEVEVKVSDRTGTLLLDNSSKLRIFMERFKPEGSSCSK